MIDDLPDPLTPADCDLRDFPYMPLDVLRLRDSDIGARTTGEEFRCAVLLWCASWHQVSAGSLPDDDVNLAQYAGFGRAVDKWLEHREGALRGWIKCSDGRLYHPVVCEKANEAWAAKHRQQYEKLVDRVRKRNKSRADAGLQPLRVPDFDRWVSSGRPLERTLFPEEFSSPVVGKDTTDAGNKTESTEVSESFRQTDPEIPPEKPLIGKGRGEVNLKPKTKGSNDDDSGITRVYAHEAPPVVDGDESMTPAKIAIALIGWERERKKPLRNVNASHPTVIEIAEMHVTPDELRKAYDAAVADRLATGDLGAVNAGFVKRLIEVARNPPKPKPKRDEWYRTNEGIKRKARELGLGDGRNGESWDALRARCESILREREAQEHAA